ncbi:MAG: hypothetical protein WCG25_02750 [bacterium]
MMLYRATLLDQEVHIQVANKLEELTEFLYTLIIAVSCNHDTLVNCKFNPVKVIILP